MTPTKPHIIKRGGIWMVTPPSYGVKQLQYRLAWLHCHYLNQRLTK